MSRFPPPWTVEALDAGFKVVDAKGASITWEKLDLTKITDVTIHYKDGKAWADVK